MKNFVFWCALLCLAAITVKAQDNDSMPQIVTKNGRHTLLVNGKPYFILGGQAHNSSAWPRMLPDVWLAIEKLHANTLEIPVYWEQVEPEQGTFDFSIADTIIMQARQHNVHLVLLWFATWKNGSNHYMPAWMKSNASKYPNITGRNGKPYDSPSPISKNAMDADAKAFTRLMAHLKEADKQHTVLMVQVENEAGAWDSMRDYSAVAQKLFDGPVPQQLLSPALLTALHVPVATHGTWQQVFGGRADEYFHAFYVATYIGRVAAAGKAVYPLPMYTNAALRDPLTNPAASTYESGGPTDNVIPIWKIAAPALDFVAPDIYLTGSEKVLKVIDLYTRPDNTLFVPEAALAPVNAKYLYQVFAEGGIGFSPFGIDDGGKNESSDSLSARLAPFAIQYAMASPMVTQLAAWSSAGRIKAVIEHEDHAEQVVNLGTWEAVVSFGIRRGTYQQGSGEANGKLMIITLSENKFLLIGSLCHVTFKPAGKNSGKAWQYLKVEEGNYDNGVFNILRIRNGDETDWGGPGFDRIPAVLQTTLVSR